MGAEDRKKSLHDVLRQRRAAKPLLTVRELQLREAARKRDEAEALASERVERWRARGKSVDAEGKLDPAVYRSVFARDPAAYFGSRHWTRRSRAQLELTPACEVRRCERTTDLHAQLLDHDALGAERMGLELLTLCEPCGRRAHKRAADLGRLLTRDEIEAIDPEEPLFDSAAIAALKARYARPLRRADVQQSR